MISKSTLKKNISLKSTSKEPSKAIFDDNSESEIEDSEEDSLYYPKMKLIKEETASSRLPKEVALYFNTELSIILDKYKAYTRLITCIHDPAFITEEKAWEKIHLDLSKIVNILEENKNILFITACIEVHTGGKGKPKASKKEKPKKSDEDKEESITLKGYPHLHLFVAYVSKAGRIVQNESIEKKIKEVSSFTSDVEVKGGERASEGKKDSLKTFGYILKNCRHSVCHEKLEEAVSKRKKSSIIYKDKRFSTKLNVFGFNSKGQEDIHGFLKGFSKLKRNSCPVYYFREEKDEPEEEIKTNQLVKLSSNGKEDESSKAELNFDIISARVIEYMEDEELYLCDNYVFKRIKGSRRTYEAIMTVDEMLGELYSDKNKDRYYDATLAEGKIKNIMTKKRQKVYPKIEISKYYIEFGDFFFHVPSASIIKGDDIPENVHCGFFCQEIDFDFIKKSMSGTKEDMKSIIPTYWLSCFEEQKFMKDKEKREDYICRYYMIRLPLLSKGGALMQIGPANSGKTSALEPILATIPKNFKAGLNGGGFSMSSIGPESVVIIDDGHTNVFKNAALKPLFNGGVTTLSIEQKGKDVREIEFNGNGAIITNTVDDILMKPKPRREEDEGDEFYDFDRLPGENEYEWQVRNMDDAYKVRFAIFIFNKSYTSDERKERATGMERRMTNFELGKMILYSSLFYSKRFLKRVDKNGVGVLRAFDTFEEAKEELQDRESLFRIKDSYPESKEKKTHRGMLKTQDEIEMENKFYEYF